MFEGTAHHYLLRVFCCIKSAESAAELLMHFKLVLYVFSRGDWNFWNQISIGSYLKWMGTYIYCISLLYSHPSVSNFLSLCKKANNMKNKQINTKQHKINGQVCDIAEKNKALSTALESNSSILWKTCLFNFLSRGRWLDPYHFHICLALETRGNS